MLPEAVNVTHDSTDSMPYSGLSAGSKTIYTVGSAVLDAARDARTQVFTIAAEMLEASSEDMELRDGKVMVKGVPEKYITLQQIAANSMRFGAPYEPVYGRGRSANRVSSPMFAAHLARAAVDPETGEVRVLDYIAAQDVSCDITTIDSRHRARDPQDDKIGCDISAKLLLFSIRWDRIVYRTLSLMQEKGLPLYTSIFKRLKGIEYDTTITVSTRE